MQVHVASEVATVVAISNHFRLYSASVLSCCLFRALAAVLCQLPLNVWIEPMTASAGRTVSHELLRRVDAAIIGILFASDDRICSHFDALSIVFM